MKVALLSYSDIGGGAAQATFRLHKALVAGGTESLLCVNQALSEDPNVFTPPGKVSTFLRSLRPHLGTIARNLLLTDGAPSPSLSLLPSRWPKRLNSLNLDVVHLHWTQWEMLSIHDISQINAPLVWTLHDMWVFSGSQHYDNSGRWASGYTADSRHINERGLDLDRWCWERKQKSWKRPISIICPSNWMAHCARSSPLLNHCKVHVIPNTIDTDVWRPHDKSSCRRLFNLPQSSKLILFGANGGVDDPRKGFDLLKKALDRLYNCSSTTDFELVIFGQSPPVVPPNSGYKTHYLGSFSDPVALIALYNAVDLLVVPSRQDNLPNVALEAHACGTPVVAFDVGGLSDIVSHQVTGVLARPEDHQSLARSISWVLNDPERLHNLGMAARSRAVSLWSYPVVSGMHQRLYRSLHE